jgi:hypothetical protein
MKKFALLVFGFVAACNYDTGECYLRDEGGAGVGGNIITPTGAGGFGDVPPEPQDATDPPPPECIVADSPCNEKCLADYVTAAEDCTKFKDETQKRSCDDSAYAVYKSCRDSCTQKENDCKERCKKQCDKIHDRCHEDCTKNDPTQTCRVKCNNEYSKCLRECEDDCK